MPVGTLIQAPNLVGRPLNLNGQRAPKSTRYNTTDPGPRSLIDTNAIVRASESRLLGLPVSLGSGSHCLFSFCVICLFVPLLDRIHPSVIFPSFQRSPVEQRSACDCDHFVHGCVLDQPSLLCTLRLDTSLTSCPMRRVLLLL